MDKYIDIKKCLLEYAEKDSDIKSIIAIGSSTREEVKADEYSDLDLLIVTENVETWYSGDYPKRLGNVKISFIEPTLGGGKERRCIYDDDKDVDMIIFTIEQFEDALKSGVAGWVMNRGYSILYDVCSFDRLINQYVEPGTSKPEMTEEAFDNLVNDFYFHNIWACKKLKRGELWSAKMCVDAYLKSHLLKVIEYYCYEIEGKDVWHDGRFIDRWAPEFVRKELSNCFAHYEKEDVKKALLATNQLFESVGKKIATHKGYSYPEQAADCAKQYLTATNNSEML